MSREWAERGWRGNRKGGRTGPRRGRDGPQGSRAGGARAPRRGHERVARRRPGAKEEALKVALTRGRRDEATTRPRAGHGGPRASREQAATGSRADCDGGRKRAAGGHMEGPHALQRLSRMSTVSESSPPECLIRLGEGGHGATAARRGLAAIAGAPGPPAPRVARGSACHMCAPYVQSL